MFAYTGASTSRCLLDNKHLRPIGADGDRAAVRAGRGGGEWGELGMLRRLGHEVRGALLAAEVCVGIIRLQISASIRASVALHQL